MTTIRSLLKPTATVSSISGIGYLMSIVYNLVLARTVGVAGLGVYYLAITVLSMASVLGRMGIDRAFLLFGGPAFDRQEWHTINGLYWWAVRFVFLISAIVGVMIYLAANLVGMVLFEMPELVDVLKIIAMTIVPYCLLLLNFEALKSVDRAGVATALKSIGTPLLALPAVLVFSKGLNAQLAITIYAVATIVVMIVSFIVWRRYVPMQRGARLQFDGRQLFRSSLPMFWTASLAVVMLWTDSLMLGWLGTAEDVGIYGIIMRILGITGFFVVVLESINVPKFAALYASGDMNALEGLVRRAATMGTFLSLPVIVLILIWPELTLGLFGSDFERGASALIVLLLGQIVNLWVGSVVQVLLMAKSQLLVSRTVTVALLGKLVLNYYFITNMGLLGAAVATATITATINLFFMWIVRHEMGIQTHVNFKFLRLSELNGASAVNSPSASETNDSH